MALDRATYRYGVGEFFGKKDRGRYWQDCTPEEVALLKAELEEGIAPEEMWMITTLQGVPGYTINKMLGVVAVLAAASGFTAEMKGNDALVKVRAQLMDQARTRGGNAVVGLTGSPFGARGGVTSAFGGDAVGIMLLGTSVIVSPDDVRTDSSEEGA